MTIDLRKRVDRCEGGFIDCVGYVECVDEVPVPRSNNFRQCLVFCDLAVRPIRFCCGWMLQLREDLDEI